MEAEDGHWSLGQKREGRGGGGEGERDIKPKIVRAKEN